MNIFWSIFLGSLQGLTEFIPVSSSGHLVLVQKFIPGFYQPGVLFDVILHLGTLLSIIYFFRKDILKMKMKYISLIIFATLPAVFVGLFFRGIFEEFFKSVSLVGVALIITGIINFLTDLGKEKTKNISTKNSLVIGLSQAIAIIPGISRSGSTIFAASFLGINKKEAARFSFLLSIPAVLGALILEVITHPFLKNSDYFFYFSGFLSAFVSGYISIKVVLKLLDKSKFKYFSYYCFILGVISLYFSK